MAIAHLDGDGSPAKMAPQACTSRGRRRQGSRSGFPLQPPWEAWPARPRRRVHKKYQLLPIIGNAVCPEEKEEVMTLLLSPSMQAGKPAKIHHPVEGIVPPPTPFPPSKIEVNAVCVSLTKRESEDQL